ncbi:hypothetical protein GmHk_03G006339 [Glycine max]|uniref:uncharacterized protein n=1 Tax=Glycine max TaxID=3847 RepID=UPI001B357EA2|nr:uncharacterized protein LOC106794103 [Glycine max]KAH1256101.1 hypothetical protein GmHk_03G006339 [Glycine max]
MKLWLARITITNKHYTLSLQKVTNTFRSTEQTMPMPMPMPKPKPMPEEQKMEYFMQVTEAPLSVAVQKLEKHGGNLNKALEEFYEKDSLQNPSQNEQHRSQKGLTVAEFLEAYPKKHGGSNLNKALEDFYEKDSLQNPGQNEQHRSQKGLTVAEFLEAYPKKKTLAELLDEGTEGSFSWQKWAASKIPLSHSQKTEAELLDEGTEGSSSWQKWAVPKILPSHSQKKQKAKWGQLPMSSSSKGPVKQKAIDPLTRPPKLPYSRIPDDKRREYLDRLWMDYSNAPNPIHITLHIPGGGCVGRIFVKSDTLEDVYGYLRLLGLGEYASESCRLATKSHVVVTVLKMAAQPWMN